MHLLRQTAADGDAVEGLFRSLFGVRVLRICTGFVPPELLLDNIQVRNEKHEPGTAFAAALRSLERVEIGSLGSNMRYDSEVRHGG